jgi:hypothetical protein
MFAYYQVKPVPEIQPVPLNNTAPQVTLASSSVSTLNTTPSSFAFHQNVFSLPNNGLCSSPVASSTVIMENSLAHSQPNDFGSNQPRLYSTSYTTVPSMSENNILPPTTVSANLNGYGGHDASVASGGAMYSNGTIAQSAATPPRIDQVQQGGMSNSPANCSGSGFMKYNRHVDSGKDQLMKSVN